MRMPSRTPLHVNWCITRCESSTPPVLISFGMIQRTKWGCVCFRLFISLCNCSWTSPASNPWDWKSEHSLGVLPRWSAYCHRPSSFLHLQLCFRFLPLPGHRRTDDPAWRSSTWRRGRRWKKRFTFPRESSELFLHRGIDRIFVLLQPGGGSVGDRSRVVMNFEMSFGFAFARLRFTELRMFAQMVVVQLLHEGLVGRLRDDTLLFQNGENTHWLQKEDRSLVRDHLRCSTFSIRSIHAWRSMPKSMKTHWMPSFLYSSCSKTNMWWLKNCWRRSLV